MGNCCLPNKKKRLKTPLLQTEYSNEEKETKKKRSNEIRIVLLGAGESGKSTFIKQMKFIANGDFDSQDKLNTKALIRKTCFNQMKVLISNSERLGINLENKELANEIKKKNDIDNWDSNFGRELKTLWDDIGIKKTYQFRNKKFHLNDSASYFFNSLERISEDDYDPITEDVLRCRVTTVGLYEETYEFDKYEITFIDVGGQRSERKKWNHCFERANSMIFFASLTGYCQVLLENSGINRMKESLNLFSQVCKSPWFVSSSIILFLNKQDLFKDLIEEIDLHEYFQEYNGGKDYDNAVEFITSKYLEVGKSSQFNKNREIFPYVTCALDTKMIKYITKVAIDTLFNNTLKTIGLI
ncbi:guanine nucleotide-binding protein alpha-4 subunit-related [Anaeramoeba flamelloides]|uniref:Guanine nucleotide-binding protein alpha-4 subunit-related n=1 Tax=Anaeramoeba flamelloides TaxID=1746091 RepID=A0AAV8A6S0_9EUKA|nr:guanine nucleotide-binding protein alpha-4 subunit-related [Anaeramoeba flamelloides]